MKVKEREREKERGRKIDMRNKDASGLWAFQTEYLVVFSFTKKKYYSNVNVSRILSGLSFGKRLLPRNEKISDLLSKFCLNNFREMYRPSLKKIMYLNVKRKRENVRINVYWLYSVG